MSSFEKMIYKQRSLISSVTNTIANFTLYKKLGQAKICDICDNEGANRDDKGEVRTMSSVRHKTAGIHNRRQDHGIVPLFFEFTKCEACDVALDYLYERLEDINIP